MIKSKKYLLYVELQNATAGLIGYVQRGGKLPPREFIQEG